jgi:hypothetical protein
MEPINPDSIEQRKQNVFGGIRYPLLYMCAVIGCPSKNDSDKVRVNCVRCILLNVNAKKREALKNLLEVVNETNQP